MKPALLFALPGNEVMTNRLATRLGAVAGNLAMRKFPDRETYLRYGTELIGKDIGLVCTLDDPDSKLIPLLLAADGARQLGASQVGLIAPYLAYMRQDARFHAGEAITSQTVATLLSRSFDWLVTVDPHLHRHHALSEIYTMPAHAVHAAPAVAAWIRANVDRPFLIGPDAESAQWVSNVAKDLGAPSATLKKHRQGDRRISLERTALREFGDRTPVLVDDIIASGQTMIEAVKMLVSGNTRPPVCLAVHGIFADGADRELADMGARVVTTDTIPGSTTEISVVDLIAGGIGNL